jgi:putative flippase GtrA
MAVDRAWMVRISKELGSFGSIGAIAFVIDVGVFNLLRTWTVLGLLDEPLLGSSPLAAKFVSVVVSTLFAYFGNRYITYRHRLDHEGAHPAPVQLTAFVLTNAVTLGVSWLVLWFTHYVLGMTSALADNISGNVVGTGIGTVLRFFAYRYLVFPAPQQDLDGDGVPDEGDVLDATERDVVAPPRSRR